MRILLLLLLLFTLTSLHVRAQREHGVTIRFVATFGGKIIQTSDDIPAAFPGTDISIETLRYYVSGVSFYMEGEEVFSEANSYHLIDASSSDKISFKIPTAQPLVFNQLRFNLGIDSITNISGVRGGDLDPTTGMYWTWQSGYINFKLEGTSKNCPARKNRFQFHLGGYAGGNNCLQQVILKVNNSNNITVRLPLDKLLATVDLTTQHTVMNPCREAVALSGTIAQSFEILP